MVLDRAPVQQRGVAEGNPSHGTEVFIAEVGTAAEAVEDAAGGWKMGDAAGVDQLGEAAAVGGTNGVGGLIPGIGIGTVEGPRAQCGPVNRFDVRHGVAKLGTDPLAKHDRIDGLGRGDEHARLQVD